MITAQEAKNKAKCSIVVKDFLKLVEDKVNEAIKNEKLNCQLYIYNQDIGDVMALYGNQPDKCLTEAGKIAVKELEQLGYKVNISLYYEERQFVDMRLTFDISWE